MKKYNIFTFLLTVLLTLSLTNFSNAQDRDKTIKEIKSKDVVKTRNYNPHIQSMVPKTDNNPQPAPIKKGGKKEEGISDVEIIIDNFTGYYIDVYIDGTYKGTIGEWGTLNLSVKKPYKKLYCVTSGGTKDWLVTGDFDDNYTWKLMK